MGYNKRNMEIEYIRSVKDLVFDAPIDKDFIEAHKEIIANAYNKDAATKGINAIQVGITFQEALKEYQSK